MIQINDMSRLDSKIKGEITDAVMRVLSSGRYILGLECLGFEQEFAAYCGVKHCVTVANGTDALEISLRVLGIGPGDTVATVANAGFYATTAILAVSAEPVFVDIDPIDHLMNVEHLAEVHHQRPINCVIVTHLYGLLHEMKDLMAFADARGIPVVEDCAQSHGARRYRRLAGSFGRVSAFSFYPTKNLGAVGDGGAVLTNDDTLAERLLALRQYGWGAKYSVKYSGGRNSRLDELQAAVLRIKLPYLDSWNQRRRDIAERYSRSIANTRICNLPVWGEEYVAHLYVLRCDDRDGLRGHLAQSGIATDVHYPTPDYSQPAMAGKGWLALPRTDRAAKQVLSLPCYPELRDDEVDVIVQKVNGW